MNLSRLSSIIAQIVFVFFATCALSCNRPLIVAKPCGGGGVGAAGVLAAALLVNRYRNSNRSSNSDSNQPATLMRPAQSRRVSSIVNTIRIERMIEAGYTSAYWYVYVRERRSVNEFVCVSYQ